MAPDLPHPFSEAQERAIFDGVIAILREADAEILALTRDTGTVCNNSGKCCKFEEYGHRLYVTTAEIIHFRAAQFEHASTPHGAARRADVTARLCAAESRHVSLPQFFAGEAKGCPYQVDNLCTAREARPLGCRIYFCDTRSQSWQNTVYEKYHAQLQTLHEQLAVPYHYVEWRQALREWLMPA